LQLKVTPYDGKPIKGVDTLEDLEFVKEVLSNQ
jgi:hypothetical protein